MNNIAEFTSKDKKPLPDGKLTIECPIQKNGNPLYIIEIDYSDDCSDILCMTEGKNEAWGCIAKWFNGD